MPGFSMWTVLIVKCEVMRELWQRSSFMGVSKDVSQWSRTNRCRECEPGGGATGKLNVLLTNTKPRLLCERYAAVWIAHGYAMTWEKNT